MIIVIIWSGIQVMWALSAFEDKNSSSSRLWATHSESCELQSAESEEEAVN